MHEHLLAEVIGEDETMIIQIIHWWTVLASMMYIYRVSPDALKKTLKIPCMMCLIWNYGNCSMTSKFCSVADWASLPHRISAVNVSCVDELEVIVQSELLVLFLVGRHHDLRGLWARVLILMNSRMKVCPLWTCRPGIWTPWWIVISFNFLESSGSWAGPDSRLASNASAKPGRNLNHSLVWISYMVEWSMHVNRFCNRLHADLDGAHKSNNSILKFQ